MGAELAKEMRNWIIKIQARRDELLKELAEIDAVLTRDGKLVLSESSAPESRPRKKSGSGLNRDTVTELARKNLTKSMTASDIRAAIWKNDRRRVSDIANIYGAMVRMIKLGQATREETTVDGKRLIMFSPVTRRAIPGE